MTILYVAYRGDAEIRFDRDYYVAIHIPLVMEAWEPHGLESCEAFFPAGHGAGTIAIAECRFRDEASLQAPETGVATPQADDWTHSGHRQPAGEA